jgi:hypothetical protein
MTIERVVRVRSGVIPRGAQRKIYHEQAAKWLKQKIRSHSSKNVSTEWSAWTGVKPYSMTNLFFKSYNRKYPDHAGQKAVFALFRPFAYLLAAKMSNLLTPTPTAGGYSRPEIENDAN